MDPVVRSLVAALHGGAAGTPWRYALAVTVTAKGRRSVVVRTSLTVR